MCLIASEVAGVEYRWLHHLRVASAKQVEEKWILKNVNNNINKTLFNTVKSGTAAPFTDHYKMTASKKKLNIICVSIMRITRV